jgi:hypothetical protein
MDTNPGLRRKLSQVLLLRAEVAAAERDLSNSPFGNKVLSTGEIQLGVLPPHDRQARPLRAGMVPRAPV